MSAQLFDGHGGKTRRRPWAHPAVLMRAAYFSDAESGPGGSGPVTAGAVLRGGCASQTLGSRLTKLSSQGAFCAEFSGALTLFGATYLKIPVSTTHTITGAIIGVGSTMKMRGIRWGLASNIVWAWVLTIPASAGMGMLCLKLFQALHVW